MNKVIRIKRERERNMEEDMDLVGWLKHNNLEKEWGGNSIRIFLTLFSTFFVISLNSKGSTRGACDEIELN